MGRSCRAPHLGSRLFRGSDVGHAFGQLEDADQVVGIDDCRYSPASASEVDRLMVCLGAVDDRRELFSRLG